MLISVVITTKNEEKNIENCLKSIRAQSYPQDKIEIVVVDNNSTDKTKEIARRYTEKVFNKGPERSAQRNYAVDKSQGEYFLQLDSDQILKEDVVEKCVQEIIKFRTSHQNRSLENIALQIPEVIIGKNSFFNRIRNYEKNFYTGTIIDCVRLMPVKFFKEIGGYDIDLNGTEDWDIDKRMRKKCKVGVLSSHMYHNEGDITFSKFIKKKWYYSLSFEKYIEKWGNDDQDVRKQLGWFYRYVGVFLENGKWKYIVKNPFLFISLLVTKIIVGFLFIFRKVVAKIQRV